MINIQFTDEQIFSVFQQLPIEKKRLLFENMKFEEWLDSPEAVSLKERSEKDELEGRVFSIEDVRKSLNIYE